MSTVCGVCNEIAINSDEIIKCAGVYNKIFHLKCVSHLLSDGVETRASKGAWFCKDCKKATSSSDKDSGRLTKKCLVSLLYDFKKRNLCWTKKNAHSLRNVNYLWNFFD